MCRHARTLGDRVPVPCALVCRRDRPVAIGVGIGRRLAGRENAHRRGDRAEQPFQDTGQRFGVFRSLHGADSVDGEPIPVRSHDLVAGVEVANVAEQPGKGDQVVQAATLQRPRGLVSLTHTQKPRQKRGRGQKDAKTPPECAERPPITTPRGRYSLVHSAVRVSLIGRRNQRGTHVKVRPGINTTGSDSSSVRPAGGRRKQRDRSTKQTDSTFSHVNATEPRSRSTRSPTRPNCRPGITLPRSSRPWHYLALPGTLWGGLCHRTPVQHMIFGWLP